MKTNIINLIPFLKKKTVEPSIYAMVVKAKNAEALKLHIGVYYSLDDAYSAGDQRY